MTEIDALHRLLDRLETEPLRILVGEITHRATEIVPSPDFAARIKAMIRDDAEREILRLSEPDDPSPASPGVAQPVPEERKVN